MGPLHLLLFLGFVFCIAGSLWLFWAIYSRLVNDEAEERRRLGLRPLHEVEPLGLRGDLLGYRHSRTQARAHVAGLDDEYAGGFLVLRLLGRSTRESIDALGAIYGGAHAGKVLLAGVVLTLACLGLGGWLFHEHHAWWGLAAFIAGLICAACGWIEARGWWEEATSMASPGWILFWVGAHVLAGVATVALSILRTLTSG